MMVELRVQLWAPTPVEQTQRRREMMLVTERLGFGRAAGIVHSTVLTGWETWTFRRTPEELRVSDMGTLLDGARALEHIEVLVRSNVGSHPWGRPVAICSQG